MKRLLAILPLAVSAASAQCVMCYRTAAAQNMERARVMNIGIFIMLIPPFRDSGRLPASMLAPE